ncbi:MAG: putative ABC transporter permease [Lachnospiraceae bacterium]|nr:putative ABC transporter permease [Lachnospiraceae bacterium]
MTFTGYELLAFFFIYAFFGWVMEIAFAAVYRKKFLNRGFLNGPVCPIYGCSMVFVTVFLESLRGNYFFLLLGCMIVTTMLELLTGMFMEKMLGRKWWDYSDYKYNLGGYVCPQFSLVWGVCAAVVMTFVQPLLTKLVRLLPGTVFRILLLTALVLLVCDFIVTIGAVCKFRRQSRRMQGLAEGMNRISGRMGRAIFEVIQRRMAKAFPNLSEEGRLAAPAVREKSGVFAAGCCFHKLIWLFAIGAFLGDLVETVFCRLTAGYWMSRSSVVYGPFSIVWGLAIALLTLVLDRYKDKDDRYILIFGTVIGGAYEYICSVFTELVFGTVFWDYSDIPFNLGGRINLLYSFFWGIAALIWLKLVYPFLSGLIEKVPVRAGTILTYLFIVFMAVNMAVSAAALARYSERNANVAAESAVERFLDDHFPDERMERIYPNAKMTD